MPCAGCTGCQSDFDSRRGRSCLATRRQTSPMYSIVGIEGFGIRLESDAPD
jgi:hypothetical protein